MYTIQPGDSLWSIATRYGLTVQQLLAANPGVNPQQLYIGQSIMIPAAGGPVPAAPAPASNQGSLAERVARLESTVAQLQEIIGQHRRQIADLQAKVGANQG